MTLTTRLIVYPDGEVQEIDHPLRVNQAVDLNGVPLSQPLPTTKMIAYRVFRMSTETKTGEEIIRYYLELLSRMDLSNL